MGVVPISALVERAIPNVITNSPMMNIAMRPIIFLSMIPVQRDYIYKRNPKTKCRVVITKDVWGCPHTKFSSHSGDDSERDDEVR